MSREDIGLEPLFAQNLPLDDSRTLTDAFKVVPQAQQDALSNPYVRTLACEAGEIPDRRHVAVALDNLATLDLVGLYHRFDEFKTILAELTGHDLLGGVQLEVSPLATQLAAQLARIAAVRRLLALDLLLYAFIDDAFRVADRESQDSSIDSAP